MLAFVSFGKAQSLHSEATSEDLPVYTTNLCFLRVRVGDEGRGVKCGQRDSQSDVNQVYYVFGHLWYLRCYDVLCKS